MGHFHEPDFKCMAHPIFTGAAGVLKYACGKGCSGQTDLGVLSIVRSASRMLVVVLSLMLFDLAHADDTASGSRLSLQLGPSTFHFQPDPEHNNDTWLTGLELESAERWLVGAVYFRNSFYQHSGYIYAGKRWFPDVLPENVYVKLTGGLLLGYNEPYDNKIPLNHRDGIGLGVLPAVGYQFERANVQLVLLGTAGLMVTFAVDLLKPD